MRSLAILLAAGSLALPWPALAGPTITLNGVSIAGVTSQKFENVNVIIDAQGNLDIQAKGYAVRVAGALAAPPPVGGLPMPAAGANTAQSALPPPPPPPIAPATSAGNGPAAGFAPAPAGKLTRRYFLATEQTQPDATQYDVEVFINASWIRVIKSADPQVVTEVTKYLHPGANKVTLSCTKKPTGGQKRAGAADARLKVVVGAGNVGGDHVMIDDPLAVMTRTAAELDDKVEEFVFEAR